VSVCCEVSLWAGAREWLDGVLEAPFGLLLYSRHHVASARLHITGAQGSSPRELVPRPPEPSQAPPIPSPLPHCHPGTAQPTAFRPQHQPHSSPAQNNQPSGRTQPDGSIALQRCQEPDSFPAWQPAALKPGIARQPSSPTHQSLPAKSRVQANKLSPLPVAPSRVSDPASLRDGPTQLR